MFSSLIVSCFAFVAAPGLLANPTWADAMADWRAEIGSATVSVLPIDAQATLAITGTTVTGYPRVVQDFAATPGALYSASSRNRP